MNLEIDFSALNGAASSMQPGQQRAAGWARNYQLDALQRRLDRGSGADLSDLSYRGGLFGIRGLQVFLYNPDQGEQIDSVLHSGKAEQTFHLTQCIALQKQRREEPSAQLVAGNSGSAVCPVFGFSRSKGQLCEGKVQLAVCKYCLHKLNYKGFRTLKNRRASICSEFSVAECFARHSTLFDHAAGYANLEVVDGKWSHGSAVYRHQRGDSCERCGVGLRLHQSLLHTHHVNGDGRDDRPENLKLLCLDCLRKAARRGYRPLGTEAMAQIQTCRREQGLLEALDWEQTIALADAAIEGLLHHYREHNQPVPQIAYPVGGGKRGIKAPCADLAWPSKKQAVSLNRPTARHLSKLGWRCLTLSEALAIMNRR